MKKSKIIIGIGIAAISIALTAGYSDVAISNSNYSEAELVVQEKIISTFGLDPKDYKLLFTKDVYDNDISKESSEIRGKIAHAISILNQAGDLKEGDFKPMIFLKGNEVLIGIKHPDKTITLSKFDISGEKPIKITHEVKEAK